MARQRDAPGWCTAGEPMRNTIGWRPGLGAAAQAVLAALLLAGNARAQDGWRGNLFDDPFLQVTGALADLPWVGLGDSGTGMTNSPDVLHLLTRPRLYVVDSNKDVEPWWYPYGPKMVDLMRILVSRQQTGGLGATLKTLGALKARMKEIKS